MTLRDIVGNRLVREVIDIESSSITNTFKNRCCNYLDSLLCFDCNSNRSRNDHGRASIETALPVVLVGRNWAVLVALTKDIEHAQYRQDPDLA